MLFWLIKILLYIPFWIIFPCFIKGKKNLPKGKCIIVCNHKSNIDYTYLFNRIWRKQFVLAKNSLFKNKLVGGFLKKCGGIPVNRDKVELSTIKDSLKILKNEKLLTIFPEATRNKTQDFLLPFKAGASVFSVKAGAPIVPVIIVKKPKIFCPNKMIFGKPIYFDDSFKGEEGTQRANEIIRNKMIEMYNKYKNKVK